MGTLTSSMPYVYVHSDGRQDEEQGDPDFGLARLNMNLRVS